MASNGAAAARSMRIALAGYNSVAGAATHTHQRAKIKKKNAVRIA